MILQSTSINLGAFGKNNYKHFLMKHRKKQKITFRVYFCHLFSHNVRKERPITNLRCQTSSFSCSKIGAKGSRLTICFSWSSTDSSARPCVCNTFIRLDTNFIYIFIYLFIVIFVRIWSVIFLLNKYWLQYTV